MLLDWFNAVAMTSVRWYYFREFLVKYSISLVFKAAIDQSGFLSVRKKLPYQFAGGYLPRYIPVPD